MEKGKKAQRSPEAAAGHLRDGGGMGAIPHYAPVRTCRQIAPLKDNGHRGFTGRTCLKDPYMQYTHAKVKIEQGTQEKYRL